MLKAKTKGFTLVELLVVMIIVAILAVVALPVMRAVKTRAIISEGVGALGTIRTAQRAYYVEFGVYRNLGWFGPTSTIPGIRVRPSVSPTVPYGTGDLDGTYFGQECYQTGTAGGITVYLYGPNDTNIRNTEAPRRADAIAIANPKQNAYITMNAQGNIRTRNIPNSGYPPVE